MKDSQTCDQCTAIDAECSTDDECCYSCCEKGLGKSTGKCTDGDMCHMGRIIIWIIVVRLVEIAAMIGVICLIIYLICKYCLGIGKKKRQSNQKVIAPAQAAYVNNFDGSSANLINSAATNNIQ